MAASEIRSHIALVESYNQGISEVDATRRGLFKSAAALAAVAALPQQVRTQAVELIQQQGPELLQAAQAMYDSSLSDQGDFWIAYDRMATVFNQGNGNSGILDSDFMSEDHWGKINMALERITGVQHDPEEHDYERDPLNQYITSLPPNELMELYNNAYVQAGAGTEWSAYTLYRIFKRFPGVLDLRNIERSKFAVEPLLPFGDAAKDVHAHQTQTISQLENDAQRLAVRLEIAQGMASRRIPDWNGEIKLPAMLLAQVAHLVPIDDPDTRHELKELWAYYSQEDYDDLDSEIKRLTHALPYAKKLLNQYKAAAGHPFHSAAPSPVSPAGHTAATGKTSSTPAQPVPVASTVPPSRRLSLLAAANKIINAFRRADRISNASLKVLEILKPEDVKVVMQRDTGQEPSEPQQPAALSAPEEPGIDLGLDQPRAAAAVPRDGAGPNRVKQKIG
jgi:hypothetical protein